eukprot:2689652-Pyramimonas_sp.AAC.1
MRRLCATLFANKLAHNSGGIRKYRVPEGSAEMLLHCSWEGKYPPTLVANRLRRACRAQPASALDMAISNFARMLSQSM